MKESSGKGGNTSTPGVGSNRPKAKSMSIHVSIQLSRRGGRRRGNNSTPGVGSNLPKAKSMSIHVSIQLSREGGLKRGVILENLVDLKPRYMLGR